MLLTPSYFFREYADTLLCEPQECIYRHIRFQKDDTLNTAFLSILTDYYDGFYGVKDVDMDDFRPYEDNGLSYRTKYADFICFDYLEYYYVFIYISFKDEYTITSFTKPK